MKNSFIHASINCEDINTKISALIPKEKIVQKTISNIDIEYVAKANFGFGDVNSCLILENINE